MCIHMYTYIYIYIYIYITLGASLRPARRRAGGRRARLPPGARCLSSRDKTMACLVYVRGGLDKGASFYSPPITPIGVVGEKERGDFGERFGALPQVKLPKLRGGDTRRRWRAQTRRAHLGHTQVVVYEAVV